MLEQTATVIEVQGDRLLLEVIPESSCKACSMNKGCGTSVLSKSVGRKVVQFELDNTLAAERGDRVVLGVPENAVISGSLLVYLLPLVLMFIVALIADQTIASDDPLRDIKIAVLALGTLAGSVLLSRRLFASSHDAWQPVLLRKLIDTRATTGTAATSTSQSAAGTTR